MRNEDSDLEAADDDDIVLMSVKLEGCCSPEFDCNFRNNEENKYSEVRGQMKRHKALLLRNATYWQ